MHGQLGIFFYKTPKTIKSELSWTELTCNMQQPHWSLQKLSDLTAVIYFKHYVSREL